MSFIIIERNLKINQKQTLFGYNCLILSKCSENIIYRILAHIFMGTFILVLIQPFTAYEENYSLDFL